MLKKNAWIAALFAATAMLFMGCPEEGGGGGGGPQPIIGNPISDGNFFRVTARQNSWDSIDIRAGKGDADNTNDFELSDSFTPNKAHTIAVDGSTTPLQGGIALGNTDSPNANKSPAVSAGTNGAFHMEFDYTWAEISDATQNIRIAVPLAATSFYIYEIKITDEDGTVTYLLSEDEEIQVLTNGYVLTNDSPITRFQKAGNPVVTFYEQVGSEPVVQLDPPEPTAVGSVVSWADVLDGGDYKVVATPTTGTPIETTTTSLSVNLRGVTGIAFDTTYSVTVTAIGTPGISTDSDPSEAIEVIVGPLYTTGDVASFTAATGLQATGLFINEWGDTARMAADNTTGIITRTPTGGSALLSIDLTKLTDLDLDTTPIIETDTIKITWAAVVGFGQVKLTAKKPGTSTDIGGGSPYIDVTAAGEGYSTDSFTIPAAGYTGADGNFATPAKLSFQDNSAGNAYWQLKIVSIEIIPAVGGGDDGEDGEN